MSTQPIDLNDDDLDGVTGGGGPDAGKAAVAMSPATGKSALHDLANTESTHVGTLSDTAMSAIEAASGKTGAGLTKSKPAFSGDPAQDLLKAAAGMETDPAKHNAAADAMKELLAKNGTDFKAMQTKVEGLMKAGVSGDQVATLLQHAVAAMKEDTGKASKSISPAPGKVPVGAGGHLGEAGAGIETTVGQSQAKIDGAASKMSEATAQQQQAILDARKQAVQGLDDMVKQVIDFVKDMQGAKSDMMQAITRA